MGQFVLQRLPKQKAVAFYDVSGLIKCWGRRGIFFGGLSGFTIGVVLVAITFTSDVLSFGIMGTLVVAIVEGAVIAGAFGACAAALCSRQ